jgi:hypothetical protein
MCKIKFLCITLFSYSILLALSFATEALFEDLNQATTYFRNSLNPQHEVGRQIIRSIAKKSDHPERVRGMKILFESGKEEDHIFASELLLRTLFITEDAIIRKNIAEILFNSTKTSWEHKIIGARVLIKDRHFSYAPAKQLFDHNSNNGKDRRKALTALREIIETRPAHNDFFSAALILEGQDTEDQRRVWVAYRELINKQGLSKANRLEIAQKLWERNEISEGEGDRVIALQTFRELSGTLLDSSDPCNIIRYRAASALEDKSPNSAKDKELYLTVYDDQVKDAVSRNKCNIGEAVLADKLFISNNDAWKNTAYSYYSKFAYGYENRGGYVEDEYGSLPRRDLFEKLLNSKEEVCKQFARNNIKSKKDKKNYDLLFRYGNADDKTYCREALRSFVANSTATILGPRAARALYETGSEGDKNYLRNLNSAFAQQVIREQETRT